MSPWSTANRRGGPGHVVRQAPVGETVRLVPLTAGQRQILREALATLESLTRVAEAPALTVLLED